MKQFYFIGLFFVSSHAMPQEAALFRIKPDSSGFELTEKGASHLAGLPLKCIVQQYPNKTGHIVKNDSDQLSSGPQALHPVFYGCFDWHSSVHGHWMLIRLMKMFPGLPETANIRAVFNRSFTPANIAVEANYFSGALEKSWERTYGWAWLLKLDEELSTWNDADAVRWQANLQPLTKRIVELWSEFLPKQTYPNRTGVHPNTAFGLAMALDYAHTAKNEAFGKLIISSARRLYLKDKNAPASWEPDGSDFLSPSLQEAALMRKLLPAKDFIDWLNHFLPLASMKHLTELPVISDRSDLQIVHLDGLCLSRSWCMHSIASALPITDNRRKLLLKAAATHLQSALPNIVSGNYGGEHWLASFAVLAMTP